MTATALKLEKSFAPSAKPDAEIVVLFPGKKETNEEIRQRQYKIQMELYLAAKAKMQQEEKTAVLLAVQHQPVRRISRTAAQQAAMQGEKGFAFKL